MLRKRSAGRSAGPDLVATLALAARGSEPIGRRAFLARSGLAAGGLAALGGLSPAMVRKAEAGPMIPGAAVTLKKNVCTHCSVGCTVIAEVQNGVWVGQEPGWESPISQGTHCAKGASVRELTKGERRLKYPLKLVGGEWKRITWDAAIDEIGNELAKIRQEFGPDSVFWLGSAKFTNEAAYLFRKLAAFWGTNNVDHQARICHSTTVAGVANTWGYGAMTNSYNDIQNSKCLLIIGGNPAEAHPVAMQHMLRGKERNRAPFIVIDPRFTRTAAHATEYVRIRPGTDIPITWGILWHIFENGWEDKEYIRQRVYGMDQVRAEVKKWTPEVVERVTGVPGEQVRRVAEALAKNKPSTVIWCMGVTQKTTGTANVRALSILQLALGNIGVAGGGANIYRGHTNVQGATDLGLDVTTLPSYYGLAEGAWKHFCRVWDVDYPYMLGRFGSKELMEKKGIPTTRWFDAALAEVGEVEQPHPFRGMIVFGHGGNTVTRMPDMLKGMEKLRLLVVADPHPTTFGAMAPMVRKDGVYLLPICTNFETDGSRSASNRSVQWGEKVVDPIFESKDDYEAMFLLARKLGFEREMFKHIKVDGVRPDPEDILREINRSCLSTGYTGQSPERLKLHMKHQADFDKITMQATQGPLQGEYYGLPWPCWGLPAWKHPGSPILYDTSRHVMEGGGTFRARFGVEREGVTLLAEGSYSKGSDLKDGYPEFTMAVLKKLGWDQELTPEERRVIELIGGEKIDEVSWQTDLSFGIIRVALKHGCLPYGNAKARCVAWNLPDPVPIHREPIYTPRGDLLADYPALNDRRDFRLPHLARSVQAKVQEQEIPKKFPFILTSGRLVEYEGGGEETRSNPWLAELQQTMFAEINTRDAERLGIKNGGWVWVYGPEDESKARVQALVTNRVGQGVVFMPFHFAGHWRGESLRKHYPEGTDPFVLGEAVNSLTTYGYDPVTFMQETKVTLCRVEPA